MPSRWSTATRSTWTWPIPPRGGTPPAPPFVTKTWWRWRSSLVGRGSDDPRLAPIDDRLFAGAHHAQVDHRRVGSVRFRSVRSDAAPVELRSGEFYRS